MAVTRTLPSAGVTEESVRFSGRISASLALKSFPRRCCFKRRFVWSASFHFLHIAEARLDSVAPRWKHAEIRMVQQIEHLHPELQLPGFSQHVQRRILVDREVQIAERWAAQ